ncbi:MAG: YceI family protein [Pseudomonadota bacterium]|jgi:polyisoprenoid-binding protein YceI
MARGARQPAVCAAAALLGLCLTGTLAADRAGAVAPGAANAAGGAPAAQRWRIDGARSSAQFRIRLLGVVPMSGEFTDLRGAIVFDPARADARVDATLSSRELRMANPGHAEWARSPEFFDAANHPLIEFRSRPIPWRVLREGGSIDGELTLRGVTREVGLKVEGGGCDPARTQACAIEVYGQVRRTDFGMAARRATVGDWVSLRLRIEAVAAVAPVR